jgi:LysM repeat protein
MPPPTATPIQTRSPRAPTPTPAPQARTYVVQSGDTLAAIAVRFGTSVEAIQAANGIADTDVILIGQVLVIP